MAGRCAELYCSNYSGMRLESRSATDHQFERCVAAILVGGKQDRAEIDADPLANLGNTGQHGDEVVRHHMFIEGHLAQVLIEHEAELVHLYLVAMWLVCGVVAMLVARPKLFG